MIEYTAGYCLCSLQNLSRMVSCIFLHYLSHIKLRSKIFSHSSVGSFLSRSIRKQTVNISDITAPPNLPRAECQHLMLTYLVDPEPVPRRVTTSHVYLSRRPTTCHAQRDNMSSSNRLESPDNKFAWWIQIANDTRHVKVLVSQQRPPADILQSRVSAKEDTKVTLIISWAISSLNVTILKVKP